MFLFMNQRGGRIRSVHYWQSRALSSLRSDVVLGRQHGCRCRYLLARKRKILCTRSAAKATVQKAPASLPSHWKDIMEQGRPGRRKALARYARLVQEINDLERTMAALTDQQLVSKTAEFKMRLAAGATLNDLLVEAFAVVREASKRVLGMRPYDVQLIGAMALHEGQIAEMQTGEGKTLVAAIAAYLNGLPGHGVHVLTVNDYLANRDANWVGKIHTFLGLTVGWINKTNKIKSPAERRRDIEQFGKDITYTTAMELGFTVLQDKQVESASLLVHRRPLNFAIVDEADYLLIDEANQAFIMSKSATDRRGQQVKISMYKVIAADEVIVQLLREEDKISGGVASMRASAKARPFSRDQSPWKPIRKKSDPRVKLEDALDCIKSGPPRDPLYQPWTDESGIEHYYYFTMSPREKWAAFSDRGITRIRDLIGLEIVRHNKRCTDVQFEELQGSIEALWAGDLPWGAVLLAGLKAHTLYIKGVDYLLVEASKDADEDLGEDTALRLQDVMPAAKTQRVVIISQATGRSLDNTKWDLHQAVEAKEGILPSPPTYVSVSVTLATILSKYRKVSGMTGTASSVETEFLSSYNLPVVPIPTYRPLQRKDHPTEMFISEEAKLVTICQRVQDAHSKRRPVLLGTDSVRQSESYYDILQHWYARHGMLVLDVCAEWLSSALDSSLGATSWLVHPALTKLLPHRIGQVQRLQAETEGRHEDLLCRANQYSRRFGQPKPRIMLLNASPSQVASEAQIIALAGLPGAITISTSMAGRGTDVLLGGNPKHLTQVALEDMLYQTLTGRPKFAERVLVGVEESNAAVMEMYQTYKDEFGMLMQHLRAAELFSREHAAAQRSTELYRAAAQWCSIEQADHLLQEVVEGAEELRAKYVRWMQLRPTPRDTNDPNVRQLQVLQSVLEFLQTHAHDPLSVCPVDSTEEDFAQSAVHSSSSAVQVPAASATSGQELPASFKPLEWMIQAKANSSILDTWAPVPGMMTESQKMALKQETIEQLRRLALFLWTQFDTWCARKADVVRKAGGLLVLATNILEHDRLEQQLRGRAGRQGDAGETMALFHATEYVFGLVGEQLQRMVDAMGPSVDASQPYTGFVIDYSIAQCRDRLQRPMYDHRRRMQEQDKVDDPCREHLDSKRRVILCGTYQQHTELVCSYIKEVVDTICRKYINSHASPQHWNLQGLCADLDALVNPSMEDPKVKQLVESRMCNSFITIPITLALLSPSSATQINPHPSLKLTPEAEQELRGILQQRYINATEAARSGSLSRWFSVGKDSAGQVEEVHSVQQGLERALQPLLQLDADCPKALQQRWHELLDLRMGEAMPLDDTPMRIQYSLTRMQQRRLGNEELELLPFEGRWGQTATVLRDQLAVMCVLARHLREQALMLSSYREERQPIHYNSVRRGLAEWQRRQLLAILDEHAEMFYEALQDLKRGVSVRTFAHFDAGVEYSLDVTSVFDETMHHFREQAVRGLFVGPVLTDTTRLDAMANLKAQFPDLIEIVVANGVASLGFKDLPSGQNNNATDNSSTTVANNESAPPTKAPNSADMQTSATAADRQAMLPTEPLLNGWEATPSRALQQNTKLASVNGSVVSNASYSGSTPKCGENAASKSTQRGGGGGGFELQGSPVSGSTDVACSADDVRRVHRMGGSLKRGQDLAKPAALAAAGLETLVSQQQQGFTQQRQETGQQQQQDCCSTVPEDHHTRCNGISVNANRPESSLATAAAASRDHNGVTWEDAAVQQVDGMSSGLEFEGWVEGFLDALEQ